MIIILPSTSLSAVVKINEIIKDCKALDTVEDKFLRRIHGLNFWNL
jgi:hypothetical protein